MKIVLAAAIVVLTGTWTSQATILSQWTFETSLLLPATSGPHAAEGGIYASTSQASGAHAGTSSYSSPVGAGSAESFSSTAWAIGDYYQFTTRTLGYSGIRLAFKAASSNTGPKDFRLAYSTDGTTFYNFMTYSVLANAVTNPIWSSDMEVSDAGLFAFNFDLSAIAALDSQNTIYLRLIDNSTTSANGGTVGTGGTSRVDDFTISANSILTGSVPEPSTFIAGALLGLPFVVQGLRRLRRHQMN